MPIVTRPRHIMYIFVKYVFEGNNIRYKPNIKVSNPAINKNNPLFFFIKCTSVN